MSKAPYVIGLDGGASHTKVAILDQQGQVLGRGVSGPANYLNVGINSAKVAIQTAITQALDDAALNLEAISAATWALAGVGRPEDQQLFQEISATLFPHIPTQIENDPLAALVGGLSHRQRIILIAGTGMIAYGEDESGQAARAGGHGRLLDQGSGYAIALAGLKAVIAAADGRGHGTRLTDQLLGLVGLAQPSQLIPWLYHPGRTPTDIARLAEPVLQQAEAGDMVAVTLLANEAQALANAVVAVAQQLDFQSPYIPFTYGGSLLTKNRFYRGLVIQLIETQCPTLQAHVPQAEADVGAGLITLASLGVRDLQASQKSALQSKIWSSEQRNCLTMDLDLKRTLEIVGAMHVADHQAVKALGAQLPQIAQVVDEITLRMRQGGRLIYVGAGTSGRLGVLDASECPPTFNTSPGQVMGIIAGGPVALTQSQEGAEDQPEQGAKALVDLQVNALDSVIGIAASGQTPFVVGALEAAAQVEALTVALTCNVPAAISKPAQFTIAPLVGPEIITGSTRLKAGTAQKLVLNMLSTGVMVRLGKTYGNLMVDVQRSNQKLQARAQRIVAQACDISPAQATQTLQQADGEVKTAIVMVRLDCSADEARDRLAKTGGVIRQLL